MIWIDLVLNILGSFALATENPAEDILVRGPFNWNEYLITPFMRITIIFQVTYGVLSLLFLLMCSDYLVYFDSKPVDKTKTIIFNTLVFLIIFNQINSRKIKNDEYNVFKGISQNKMFFIIVLITVVLQIFVVQFGGKSLECHPLNKEEFLLCVGIGSGSLLVGFFARILPENLFENISFLKEKKKNTDDIGDKFMKKFMEKKTNILM